MPRFTDQERREILRFLEADKPLPEKFRFLLFADKREIELALEARLEICQLSYLLQQMPELRVKERVKVTGPRAVEMFHTVVLNEVEIGESGIRRQVVTELDGPQRAVLDAAGIDPTAFQKG